MSATNSLFNDPPDDFHPADDRPSPVVWIRRLAILERLSPDVEPIRVVEFRRGLNIIATARPDAGDGAVGHNVGKTLLTRLMRYCLGEPTFARQRTRDAIAQVLPDAHVIAEVVIDDIAWVVARPIGAARAADSWCLRSDDWRIALDSSIKGDRMSAVIDVLTQMTVARFSETLLPHQKRPVRWQDLLAWLSRDQFCRYRDPLEWRTAATESGTSELHAEDASILIRLVMDLLDDEERALIDSHKRMLAEKAAKSASLSDLNGELAHTRRFLRQRLEIDDDLLTDDLFGAEAKKRALRKRRRLKEQIAALPETEGLLISQIAVDAARDNVTRTQQELDLRQADRQTAEGVLAQHQTASDAEFVASFASLNNPCPLPVGECPLRGSATPGERSSIRAALVQDKVNELQQLDQLLAELNSKLATTKTAFVQLKRQHEALDNRVWAKRRRLASILASIDAIVREADGYIKDSATHAEHATKLAKLERQLTDSRLSHREARDQVARKHAALNQHFNIVLRRLLGAVSSGHINIDMNGIRLTLGDEGSSPGEAMATSGTVHSLDLACLRASIAGLGWMPRLLIHDSPREGDLEPHIYAHLFTCAADLETHYQGREPSFQYIVATTTPPPTELGGEPFTRLVLDARLRDGLLLKRRF